jgi:hypothetical protein
MKEMSKELRREKKKRRDGMRRRRRRMREPRWTPSKLMT